MATKKLFVVVNDGGDGSYYPKFTFDEEWIRYMKDKYDSGAISCPDIGCDGDGFHYTVLHVPEECTLDSLGVKDRSLNISSHYLLI